MSHTRERMDKLLIKSPVREGRCLGRRADMSFLRHRPRAGRMYPESHAAAEDQPLSQPRASQDPLQMYPLVRELAGDGIPVAVTCRVLKLARQPYYRWLTGPVGPAELDEAYLA